MQCVARINHSFLARKPISRALEEESHGTKLRKSLSSMDLLAIGIGAIIGAGIFVLSGIGAHDAGPAVILSFLLSGIACAFAALCYSEMASMIPVAGSAYTYAYVTMGEIVAWIIGWDLILEYILGASTVASGWSGYMVSLLGDAGVSIPHRLRSGPFNGGLIDLPALIIVVIVTAVITVGIKEGTRFTKALVALKLMVITIVIAVGIFYVNPSYWHPFMPLGPSSVVRAAAVVFIAYIGFDVVSTTAEEVKNPQRDLPIGIIGSLIICTVLYMAMGIVVTGMVPWQMINVESPVASAFEATGQRLISAFLSAGVIIGLTSVIAALMIGQPRIFMAMARDGLLPKWAAQVSHRFGTPVATTLVTGAAVGITSSLLPIESLAHMTSIGTLLAFVLVCGGVLMLRRHSPEIHRPFKTPFMPWVPILGMIICIGLMLGLPMETWLRLLIWMAIGLAIYFGYGRRHSRLEES